MHGPELVKTKPMQDPLFPIVGLTGTTAPEQSSLFRELCDKSGRKRRMLDRLTQSSAKHTSHKCKQLPVERNGGSGQQKSALSRLLEPPEVG